MVSILGTDKNATRAVNSSIIDLYNNHIILEYSNLLWFINTVSTEHGILLTNINSSECLQY